MIDSPEFKLWTQWLYIAALPYFFGAMALEGWAIKRQGPGAWYAGYEWRDSLCSMAMGALKLVTMAIAALWALPIMMWLYQQRVVDLPVSSWWFVPLVVLADDFCYYWYHRCAHRCAAFWAEHSNHHTSEHYNLSTALRQSVLGPVYTFVFWLPLPWLGMDPLAVTFAHTINLLYQYWIHTETFEVKGWFERVFNCPQHHRLHHAKNTEYHDCNYGGILIVWDRWFGTYKDFVPGVKPVYGTLTPVLTTNPLKQAVAGWGHLLHKVRAARGLKNRMLCFVKPPGWVPE
ncbi:MAG TPA: sterol desaturase family protein [Limnobacter sp.]|nr:sterol desaturase family protein [Limnobacter sp.]